MCGTCGCATKSSKSEHSHHHHGTDCSAHHHHHDEHDLHESRLIEIESNILAHNDLHAESNRRFLDSRGIKAFNLMSSPGAGKTTLLEETLSVLGDELPSCVLVGDQRTDRDAERLQRFGQPVKQIETGDLCHLDAVRVGGFIETLVEERTRLLFIENVGNLICPAAFNLGEHFKVALLSVAEGEDKPLKYPAMFSLVDAVVLTKTDLLPYLDFDIAKCRDFIRQVSARAEIIELSVKSKEGFERWIQFVRGKVVR